MEQSEDFQEGLREVMRGFMEEVLEAEMEEALGATKGERSETRRGYRSGHYSRGLVTRLGKIELRVPQDRNGLFSTEVFERYQRSEKALVASLVEMYVQGVSTRKVKKITEELCGHSFSKSAVQPLGAGPRRANWSDSPTAFWKRSIPTSSWMRVMRRRGTKVE